MKNILFLLGSLDVGGAEKQVVSLFNGINRSKFNVFLGYLDDGDTLLSQIDRALHKNIFCLKRKKKIDFKVLKKIAEEIIRRDIKTLVCVNEYTMFYGYIIKTFYNNDILLIVVMHTTILSTFYNKFKNVIYKRMMNRCDNVIFVCKNQMNYWIEKYSTNRKLCHYIHNGVDTNHFDNNISDKVKLNLKMKYGVSGDDILVGICANLRPEKKHEDLIIAAKRIIHEGINLKVLIIGDGPRREFLEEIIGIHDLDDFIFITGFKRDVRKYISICDLIVMTSHSVETFSISILEAMGMSKGIIATDIGGASEMVFEGKNGYLYRPGDIDSLTQIIKKINDDDLFESLGRASRQIVERQFDISTMIQKYEHFLSS